MDIATGLIIWSAEATTLAVLLMSRWFYQRENFYLTWGAGFGLHALGVTLLAARGSIPDFISIEVANLTLFVAIGLWITGLLQFDEKPVDGYVAIPALLWIAGMFVDPVRDSFANRVILYNGAAMVGYAMMIGLLVRDKGPSRSTRRFMAGLIAIQFLAGGISVIFSLVTRPSSFADAPSVTLLFFPAAFCFMGAIMAGAKLLTERAEGKLKALALADPLTSVLNRRGLIDHFHRLRAARRTDKPFLALLHFDLDSFKQINDRHGHQAGDAVLVAFSRVGESALRGRGLFARMGGEEFASILAVGDAIEAASIAEAVRVTVKRQSIPVGDQSLRVTVSVGIAIANAHEADLDLLLSAADRALYAAKESGRDRSAVHTGSEVSIVPAVDRSLNEENVADRGIDHQVAALQRFVALGRR